MQYVDLIVKIIQGLFYITGAVVAIKTYLSAKDGLLNTINIEYQKKVLDKLQEVSQELYNDVFRTELNNFAHTKIPLEYIEVYCKDGPEALDPGVRIPEEVRNLGSLVDYLISEPFLPNKIRDEVVEHLEVRAEGMEGVFLEELREFKEDLKDSKYDINKLQTENEKMYLAAGISNKINSGLYAKGCGISQVEGDIHNLRLQIKNYLDSYDPFNKVPWYKRLLRVY